MLTQHGPDLWTLDQPLKLGGAAFGTRSTIVRLPSGDLWVLSPTEPTAEVQAALNGLGPVRYLVAPNTFHHLYVPAAQAAWPQAELWISAALAAKKPGLSPTGLLDAPLPAEWSPVLQAIHLDGMPKLDETAFLHPGSATLVLTDLAFNFSPADWWSNTMFRMAGCHDRFGPSYFCRSMMKDKAALRRSLDGLLAHDFSRLSLAHGGLVEQDGPDILREAFAFLP